MSDLPKSSRMPVDETALRLLCRRLTDQEPETMAVDELKRHDLLFSDGDAHFEIEMVPCVKVVTTQGPIDELEEEERPRDSSLIEVMVCYRYLPLVEGGWRGYMHGDPVLAMPGGMVGARVTRTGDTFVDHYWAERSRDERTWEELQNKLKPTEDQSTGFDSHTASNGGQEHV